MTKAARVARQNAQSAARAATPGAVVAWQRGKPEFAEAGLKAALLSNPSDRTVSSALEGMAHKPGEAKTRHRQPVAAELVDPIALCNLGIALQREGQHAEAAKQLRAAIALDPGCGKAWHRLGHAMRELGNYLDALHAYHKAAIHLPGSADTHGDYGAMLFGLNRNQEAYEELHRALTLDPSNASAHGNLSALLLRTGYPIAAESECRAAIAREPTQYRWLTNLGVALLMQCRFSEAAECARKALAQNPDYAIAHGNLLFDLTYRSDLSATSIFAEFLEWDRRHARPLAPTNPNFALDRSPGRKLRVGYVSADFRQHAVALFAEPLLRAHDRTCVELYIYSGVAAEDATTQRFRALADQWCDTVALNDAQLAQRIRGDRIDVLVDLSGHSACNRLLTFARRPAPVQVAYLLGHGYTTGLSQMDAFLADEALAPPGSEAFFSERIVRLPRIPLAYEPPHDMPPVEPLPAPRRGCVTFGYFGRTERLNDQVISAWARILSATPRARLVLNNLPFHEPAFRALFLARFARHGIASDRLDLVYTEPQPLTWAAYADIDIALDPFPHNAGTTTIEALWQGVPVISLAGRPSFGRLGASILHAAGLDDWVTDHLDQYVARAIAAAADLPALARLREQLRPRMERSPLRDASGLARSVERSFRMLWDEWRLGDSTNLRQLYQAGDTTAATDVAHRILDRDPDNAEAHHVISLVAYRDNRLTDADQHLLIAIRSTPHRSELHANHAAILRKQGRLVEAEAAARTALRLEPNSVGALNNLGNILRDTGRYDEGAQHFRAAVRLVPDFADAWVNLAWLLSLAGQAQDAEDAARRAIACAPDNADAHNNLGLALMRQGRLAEAEAALRHALALRPDFALPHSNILFCLNYRPDITPEQVFAEYQRWDRQHAQSLCPKDASYELDRSPTRKLRVGYVSPDFRQHAVALFAEPLLANHDRSAIEVHCYAEVAAPDAVTERFRALADHWHQSVGLSDAALAEQIRADRIDILVDMAGHTAGNRLLAFARKPAPIQLTYLLGHGYSSGLSAMDGFLADVQLVPPDADHLFSEQVIRLPRIPLCYQPPAGMPDVGPLPARSNGHITFGYFGRTVRLNDKVIATWARILRCVPNARLMLNSAPFGEAAGRERMAARFAALGIDTDRLTLICTSPQPATWAAYADIDIALDPFPHNAGTTTIEALWQGVPVVSLAGRPTVGRFGAAILHATGLDDWVTHDVESYVARATEAAGDPDALDGLRAALRARIAASPLRDAAGLAQHIESVYRTLWQNWCDGDDTARMRQRYAAGDHADATALAEAILARNPNHTGALHILGLVRLNAGDASSATALLRRAAAVHADAAILSDLGVALRSQQRFSEAEAAYREALRLDPTSIHALGNLGNVLLDMHRSHEAEAELRRALHLAPNRPWLLHSLALALLAQGAVQGAEIVLRQALAVDPESTDAHETLAILLAQNGRPVESAAHHRAALANQTQRHRVLSNLATALQVQGRHQEAIDACRQALAERPDYATAHSNLLFALNYASGVSPEEAFAEYRAWDRRHAAPLAPAKPEFALDRSCTRRLRIGYVSADFRAHAVALFAEPLLAAHDRSGTEVVCYAEVAAPDATTRRFHALADQWRDITGLSDVAVADMIRQDQVDVLVDLTGHTAGSRLLVFARKPAPVQVTCLLGHGYSSGMSAMDVFLSDAALTPPGSERYFSERIVRLPRLPLAYAPPENMPPVSELPALADGTITFGYFGRPDRLTDEVAAAWARILDAVPGSRLVLNSFSFREPAFRALVATRFIRFGVARERLRMLATAPQPRTWAAYQAIDIALDPFPHNAGTTTIEALWQGIPVISLAGRPSVGRFGAMIMHAIGMDDWVTHDVDDYIARAVAMACDLPALAQTRAELRPCVAASPLCDAADLARHVETAYREAWNAWQQSC